MLNLVWRLVLGTVECNWAAENTINPPGGQMTRVCGSSCNGSSACGCLRVSPPRRRYSVGSMNRLASAVTPVRDLNFLSPVRFREVRNLTARMRQGDRGIPYTLGSQPCRGCGSIRQPQRVLERKRIKPLDEAHHQHHPGNEEGDEAHLHRHLAEPSPTPNPTAMKYTLDVTLPEMLDVRNRTLGEVAKPDDFIISNHIVERLRTHAHERPTPPSLRETFAAVVSRFNQCVF